MKESPSYFGIMTAEVRYDKRLKPMEKILYVEISALLSMNGVCEASNSYFAELYDVSVETVSRWVSNLIKFGYIERELIYRKNTQEIEKRVIRIITKVDNETAKKEKKKVLTKTSNPIDKKVNTYCEKSQGGIDKKVKDINTLTESINIKNTKKDFDNFIKLLKARVPIKSKVTKTDKGFDFFKSIENKEKLITDYVQHQEEHLNFSKRITAFMEDYDFHASKNSSTKSNNDTWGWK